MTAVAERGEPALHGGHLAGLVGRQDQRRHQLDAPVPLGRVEQMLDGHRRGAVGLVPVRGPQVQLHDDVRLDPAQLPEQELLEQTVVAVPLAPAVEGDQEDVRGLHVAQLLLRPRLGEERIAERCTELVEHRGVAQEPLGLLRDLGQRLSVQVVGHVPILTRDREPLPVALARDQRRQVQADRPALGPLGHRSSHVAGQADPGPREDLLGPGGVERQVACRELHRVARAPQPWQMGLFGTARRDQLCARGYPRDHDAQGVVTRGRLQLVQVVQHEHERDRAGPQGRSEVRRRASQHRDAETAHVGDEVVVAGCHTGVRGRQHGEQHGGIVVEAVEGHPCDGPILRAGPLGQQGRLAVARGRGDGDHAAVAAAGRLDQRGAAHGARARRRDRELGLEQQLVQCRNLGRRPAHVLGHTQMVRDRVRGRPRSGSAVSRDVLAGGGSGTTTSRRSARRPARRC